MRYEVEINRLSNYMKEKYNQAVNFLKSCKLDKAKVLCLEILEEQQDSLIETLAIYETIEEITGETTLHEQDVLSSKKSMKDIELQILKIKEEGNKRSSEALAVEKRLSASQVSVLDNYRQFNSQFLSLQERRDALINRRVAVNRTLGEKFGMTFEDVLSGKTPGPSMDPEEQIEKLKEFEILQ